MNAPDQLNPLNFRSIGSGMAVKSLLMLLLAFAIALAPFAISNGAAAAVSAVTHNAQMNEPGHCSGEESGNGEEKATDQSCCIASCAPVAVAPLLPRLSHEISGNAARTSHATFGHGFLAELPTPPPRVV